MLKVHGQKFRIALAKSKMDLKSFAEAAGISKNIAYRFTRGNYVKPKYVGIAAEVLGIEAEDILEGQEASESSGK